MNIYDKKPSVADGTFIAPSASVIGDVKIGPKSSIWYGSVVRGDVNYVTIGEETNVQDRCVIHVAKIAGNNPTKIGNKVTIGHGAVIHACTIEDEVIIGMGATVLDGAVVQKHAIVAAGAVVPPGKTVPSGELWAGNPAKFLRTVTDAEKAFFTKSATEYTKLAEDHADEWKKTHEQLEEEKAARKDARIRDPTYA
eukprot:tig00000093_g3647.t1